jgi:hypothetical protein
MTAFRVLLVAIVVILGAYTSVVIANHGPNLFPTFFGDMAEMGWPGQFNLDFMCMLILSGLWVAWRHRFSGAGVALGVGALFLGAPYLSIYLLVATARAGGDMRQVLLGNARAGV